MTKFFSFIVSLVIIGLAQIPMNNIYASVTYMNDIPALKPNVSPNQPINSCTTAPPIIAVHKIPENEPCCLLTELSANEKMIDHITESQNPTIGKAISAAFPEPNNAPVKKIVAKITAVIKIFLLSKNFNRTNPIKHPIDIIPQNHPTIDEPIVIGS